MILFIKALAYVLGAALALTTFLDLALSLPLPLWTRVALTAIIVVLWPVTLPLYALWTVVLFFRM